jgi:cilia- and flagella-associated protein 52
VSNNGVYSVVVQNDIIYCGGGDGKLKKLVGKATKYNLDKEVGLEGRIVSLTMSNDGKELMSGTSAGKIFKSLSADLSSTVHAEGHVEYISEVSFKRDSLDLFATIDLAGIILVWDINNMNVLTRCLPANTQKPKGRCVSIADDGTVVSGWEDGFIRCFEVSQKKFSGQAWEIVNAHRGPVTTIYCVSSSYT